MTRISVEFVNSQRKMPVSNQLKALIRRVCEAVLDEQRLDFGAEVCVTFVSDKRIREINRETRAIDRATDVLSFPLGEGGEYDSDPATGLKMLGDVVISLEHAAAQAEEYGHSYEREVGFLTAHSMLHLLGYDHVNNEDEAKVMRFHEKRVMDAVNLKREG